MAVVKKWHKDHSVNQSINHWLLLDVKQKTIFLDVKKFKGQKKKMSFNKKNPDLFGYKTIDIIY